MVIGAIFQAGKGVKKNSEIKKKNEEAKRVIQTYSSRSAFTNSIEDVYGRTTAENQLLMTEYMTKRVEYKDNPQRIIKLWNRTKIEMEQNLKNVENQLQGQVATKLDVARIVTGLSQLSGEYDKEMISLKKDLQTKVSDKLQEHSLNMQKKHIDINHSITNMENIVISKLEKTERNQKKVIDNVKKDVQIQLYEHSLDMQKKQNEINQYITKMENILISKLEEAEGNQKKAIENVKKETKESFLETKELFTCHLSELKNELSTLIEFQNKTIYIFQENIQQELISMATKEEKERKKQQSFFLKMTIPLYVLSASIIGIVMSLLIK